MQTIRQQAEAETGGLVEVNRLQWLDQLDKARPTNRFWAQSVADYKQGSLAVGVEKISISRAAVIAICDLESGREPAPEAAADDVPCEPAPEAAADDVPF